MALAIPGPGQADSFLDDFATGLNTTYWSVSTNQPLYVLNDALGDIRLSKPAGGTYSFQTIDIDFKFDVLGDFDVSVDFRDASIDRRDGSPANQIQFNAVFGGQYFAVVRDDDVSAGDNAHVYVDPPSAWRGARSTTANAGTLRIQRVGSTVTGYFNGAVVHSGVYNANTLTKLWLSLQNNGTKDPTSVTFDNFTLTTSGCIPGLGDTPPNPSPPPLMFADTFAGGLRSAIWSVSTNQPLYVMNDALGDIRLSKPAGGTYSFQTIDIDFKHDVLGDFDVSVDFRDASIDRQDGSPANQIQFNAVFGGQYFAVVRDDDVSAGDNAHVYVDPPSAWRGARSTTANAGTLRIQRVGSTVTGYFNGAVVHSATFNGSTLTRLWFSLQNNGTKDPTAVTFDNFSLTGGCIPGLDDTPPSLTPPANASYQCPSSVPSASPGDAMASDAGGPVTVGVSESTNGGEGSAASPLVITRTFVATDAAGNSVSASQVITVIDDTSPALTVPADLAAVTGPGIEPCAEVRLLLEPGAATATDNCGTATVTVAGLPEGNLFPVGDTEITWTATDAVGNATVATQHVVVSCPVGSISGAASLVCNGQSLPAADVAVQLLHEGAPFRSTTTGGSGAFAFSDVRHGTYTVAITAPAGYAVAPDTRLVTLAGADAAVEPFAFTCLLSDLTGQTNGTCNASTSGLQGVTVDVYRDDGFGTDVLVATAATDATGSFRFDDLALGDYSVGVVLPLGMTGGAVQDVTLATPDGVVALPAFALACQPIAAQPRAMGYWKHQVNVYLTGKGHAQESLADLLHFVDELVVHFNENLVNPVVVYVPGAASTNDQLLQLQQLLTVNRGGTELERAKQHLLALLLNVVSAKISQFEVISDNGANVSQAITHAHDLIVDGNPANDATARTIAETINGGQRVPAGLVPHETRLITYEQAGGPEVAFGIRSVPNPVRGTFAVELAIGGGDPAYVDLLDITGRRVWRQEVVGAGRQSVRIGDGLGLASGVYRLRLLQAGLVATRTIVVTR